ncbi:MAG: glycosyltransferase [Patescibacteria group bacterium]
MKRKSILIVEDARYSRHGASYGSVLARGLADEFDIFSSGNFFKTISLSGRADYIFSVSPAGAGRYAYWASKFRKKKFLLRIDDDYVWRSTIASGKTFLLASDFHNFPKKRNILLAYKKQIKICNQAEVIVVPSKFMAGIIGDWGVNREKIKIVADPVFFESININKEEARRKIGIPGNLLISAGPLVSWGGFRMLIKLMPQFISINQFFRLIIVGDGPERKILGAMIKNLNLDKKVYLMGKKDEKEMALLLTAADMVILNSGHEVFPVEALRSMAAGVPVIATAVGANLELIKQGENGFVVKYNDEFNLVEAVKTVWQTQELRNGFIQEGRKTAQNFSPEKTVEEIKKIIKLV